MDALVSKCTDIFSVTFMPHGHCYFWKPEILWPMVLGDAITVVAYLAIPVVLLRFLQLRSDIKFRFIFVAFAAFIFSCGLVHFMEVVNVWKPYYVTTAILKVAMATISIGTVIILIKEFPNALKIPNIAELERVNQQLKAEAAQRQEAEQKFETIFNNTFQFMGLLKPDGTILEANNTALALSGLSAEDIIGTKLWDSPWMTGHSEEREKLKDAIEDAASGKFVRYDIELTGKDNQKAVIDFSIRPLKDETGKVVQLIPEGRDISDKKKLEKNLADAEKRYRSIFATVEDGIVFQNLKGEIIDANGAAQKILGRSLDQLTNMTSEDEGWKAVHEDGTPYAGEEHPPMQALKTGKPYLNKILGGYSPERDDLAWIRSSAYPIKDDDGNMTGVYSTFKDITEEYLAKKSLEQSEKMFQLAVAGSMAGVWDWIDLEGVKAWFSERFCELLGYQHSEFTHTLDFFGDLLHPEDREKSLTALRLHLKTKSAYEVEYRVKHKTSGYRWFLGSGQAMWNDEGKPIRMVGTIIDIHDRKVAVAEQEKTAQKLRQKIEELEQFTFIASHDLQEPVRTIVSLVGLFRETYASKLDEERLQYLQHMETSSARSQQLVADLLRYTRIGTAEKIDGTDLNEVFDEVTNDLKSRIEDKNAKIQVDKLPKANVIPQDFKLLFHSLLSNSLKFTKPDENPIIKITYKQHEGMHQIAFSDNGIGVDPKFFDRIFVVFKRLHAREDYPGTGIGLAYCKKIMEVHDGRIEVDSSLGNGAVFTIYFPIADSGPSGTKA